MSRPTIPLLVLFFKKGVLTLEEIGRATIGPKWTAPEAYNALGSLRRALRHNKIDLRIVNLGHNRGWKMEDFSATD